MSATYLSRRDIPLPEASFTDDTVYAWFASLGLFVALVIVWFVRPPVV